MSKVEFGAMMIFGSEELMAVGCMDAVASPVEIDAAIIIELGSHIDVPGLVAEGVMTDGVLVSVGTAVGGAVILPEADRPDVALVMIGFRVVAPTSVAFSPEVMAGGNVTLAGREPEAVAV